MTVGSQIRRCRNMKNWTLSQLGERAKLRESTLSEIENGKHGPSMKSLKRVAEALEVEVGYLFQAE